MFEATGTMIPDGQADAFPLHTVSLAEPATDALRYSICTVVTRPQEYARMVAGFRARGFDDRTDCEFIYVDNSHGNQLDAFAAYNRFLGEARGRHIILCHQDIELLKDDRARLDEALGELDRIDPHWGLCGNAGGIRFGRLAIRISGPRFDDVTQNGPFPVLCHTLDENFIIVRRQANLALPRDRSGFHLYGTELCMIADILGWKAYIIDFHLYHHGIGLLDKEFNRQLNLFIDKYRSVQVPRWISTPCTDVFVSASGIANTLVNRRGPLWIARQISRLLASG